MTLKTQVGPFTMGAGDFVVEWRGVKFGVKFTQYPEWTLALLLVETPEGWVSVLTLDQEVLATLASFDNNIVRYINEFLIPKLNMWASAKFIEGESPLSLMEQLDIAFQKVTVVRHANGTLTFIGIS